MRKNPLDFNDLQTERFSAFKGYGRSKSANVMFTVQLAKNLKSNGKQQATIITYIQIVGSLNNFLTVCTG